MYPSSADTLRKDTGSTRRDAKCVEREEGNMAVLLILRKENTR